MRRLYALAIILVSMAIWTTRGYSDVKTSIAVLPFEARNVRADIAEAVSDILSVELFNTNRFQVIERQAINRILEEQKLQMTGITDMSQAVEVGKLLNVEKIMIGSVSRLGKTFIINSRLVDVKTGALELAQNVKSETGEEGLPNAVSELVKGFSQKITVEGTIIKVTPRTILIDIGEKDGVTIGQELDVIRLGDVITDLAGTTIGQAEDVIGRLRVLKLSDEYSEASIVEQKLQFRLGDRVRLKSVTAGPVKKTQKPKKKKKKTDAKPSTLPPVF